MQSHEHKRRVGWRALFHLELDNCTQTLQESLRVEVGSSKALKQGHPFFATALGWGDCPAVPLLPQTQTFAPLAASAPLTNHHPIIAPKVAVLLGR